MPGIQAGMLAGLALVVCLPSVLGSAAYWRWGDDSTGDVLQGSVDMVRLVTAIATDNAMLLVQSFSGKVTSMPDADLIFARTELVGQTLTCEWRTVGQVQNDRRHAYLLVVRTGTRLALPKTFSLVWMDGRMVYRNDLAAEPVKLDTNPDFSLAGQSLVLRISESVVSAQEWKNPVLAVVKFDQDHELSVEDPSVELHGFVDFARIEQTSAVAEPSMVALVMLLCLALLAKTRAPENCWVVDVG